MSEVSGAGSHVCLTNMCSCSGGSPAVFDGDGDTLCKVHRVEDCSTCDSQFFMSRNNDTSYRSCFPVHNCSSTEYESYGPTATSNRVCEECSEYPCASGYSPSCTNMIPTCIENPQSSHAGVIGGSIAGLIIIFAVGITIRSRMVAKASTKEVDQLSHANTSSSIPTGSPEVKEQQDGYSNAIYSDGYSNAMYANPLFTGAQLDEKASLTWTSQTDDLSTYAEPTTPFFSEQYLQGNRQPPQESRMPTHNQTQVIYEGLYENEDYLDVQDESAPVEPSIYLDADEIPVASATHTVSSSNDYVTMTALPETEKRGAIKTSKKKRPPPVQVTEPGTDAFSMEDPRVPMTPLSVHDLPQSVSTELLAYKVATPAYVRVNWPTDLEALSTPGLIASGHSLFDENVGPPASMGIYSSIADPSDVKSNTEDIV